MEDHGLGSRDSSLRRGRQVTKFGEELCSRKQVESGMDHYTEIWDSYRQDIRDSTGFGSASGEFLCGQDYTL